MSDNDTDVLVPPYISAGELSRFMTLMGKRFLDPISIKNLQVNGFSQGNSYTLMSSIKSMGLVDEDGNVVEREDLIDLGSKDDKIRSEALKRVVVRTYSGLLDTIPIEDTSVENVSRYFQLQDNAISISKKAARLFLWLANEAGFKTGEEFKPYKVRTRSTSSKSKKDKYNEETRGTDGNESAVMTSVPAFVNGTKGTAEDYEEQLLIILMEKISSADGLPDPEILIQVRELIEAKKQNEKEDSEADNPQREDTILFDESDVGDGE